jgi:hypothetical protein
MSNEKRKGGKVVVWGKRVRGKKWGKNSKVPAPRRARSHNEFGQKTSGRAVKIIFFV